MAELSKKCPKCGGVLVQGFILDYTYGGIIAQNWHEGRPQKSFWTGTTRPKSKGVPIAAFRCSSCGFIEFYSREEFEAV